MFKIKKITSIVLSLVMLMSTIAGMTFTTVAATNNTTTEVSVTYDQTNARKLLSKINALRTGDDAWYYNEDGSVYTCSGLSELIYDYDLEKVAMQRAAEIGVYYSHTRPDGQSWYVTYDDCGFTYISCGENIASGFTTLAGVFAGWEEEDCDYSGQAHRRNMLSTKFNTVAFAHAVIDGVDYWVTEFANVTTPNTTVTTANDSTTIMTVATSTSTDTDTGTSDSSSGSSSSSSDTTTGSLASTACGITFSWISKTYVGTVQRPTITVDDSEGNALTYKKDFTVTFSDFNSKDVGTYTATVNFIGDYAGKASQTHSYKIVAQTSVTPVLNRNTITMNGTVQRPTVTVTDKYGNKLTYKKDFTVDYSNWSSTAVGRYTVTVKMIGNYSGTKTYPYYINPKSTTISSVSALSKGFTVKWNKQTNSTTGYQIQYATKSDFSNAATIYAGASSATSKTVTGRASKTKYYVRIRTYKNNGGKYFYSDWSSAKTVTTK